MMDWLFQSWAEEGLRCGVCGCAGVCWALWDGFAAEGFRARRGWHVEEHRHARSALSLEGCGFATGEW